MFAAEEKDFFPVQTGTMEIQNDLKMFFLIQRFQCTDFRIDRIVPVIPVMVMRNARFPLQTFLDARIVQTSYKKQETDCNVAPALLFIQHASADDYNPILKFGNEYINDVATPDGDRFVRLLLEKIDEIFDPDRPFVPTADADRCLNCPYLRICGL